MRHALIAASLLAASPAVAADDDAPPAPPPPEEEKRVEVFGQLHVDSATFMDDGGRYDDTIDIRRARVGIQGPVGNSNFSFRLSWEVTVDRETQFVDGYVRYNFSDSTLLTVGQQLPPFSLDNLTSSNHLMLIERGAPINSMVEGRRIGAQLFHHRPRYSLAAGLFGGSSNAWELADDDVMAAGRATILVADGPAAIVHLGAGVQSVWPPDDVGRVRFRPDTRLADMRIIDTGELGNTSRRDAANLEFAGAFGRLFSQAEVYVQRLERGGGLEDANFAGWYAQAGWLLTGEQRTYRGNPAVFSAPAAGDPLFGGGLGAIEAVVRLSGLDLNDAPVLGGRYFSTTLGLNWYPIDNVRIAANYVLTDTDENAIDPANDPDILIFRAQVTF